MMKDRIVKVGVIALAIGAPLGAQAYTMYNSIWVETVADNTSSDGLCSLREAIVNANNNTQTYSDCNGGLPGPSTADNIYFDSTVTGQTVTLLSSLPVITDDVVISGAGRTINGGATTGSLFTFSPTTSKTLDIREFTLINAGATSDGALARVTAGNFKASNVMFSDSSTSARGGALYLASGTSATVASSKLLRNIAGNSGGAIYADGAVLTLNDVEIESNGSTYGHGGGIYLLGGSLTMSHGAIIKNTLSNTSAVWGGAINASNATVKLNNVTVASNTGGTLPGVYLYNVNGGLANVTISGNKASVVPSTPVGTGIDATAGTTGFKIRNSIVSNNKNSSGNLVNCELTGVADDGYNMEDGGSCFSAATSKNVSGEFLFGLGVLGLHGGTIQTMPIDMNDAGAVDGGNPDGCRDMNGSLLTRDARIDTTVRSIDGDGDGVARCDVGAYEFAAMGGIQMSLDKTVTVEGALNPVITLRRRGELLPFPTTLQTSNGTAIAGSDFTALNLTQSWLAASSGSKSVLLSITNDTTIESNENLVLTLTSTDAGVDLVDAQQTVTIVDNDLLVSIDGANSDVSMMETQTMVDYLVRVKLNKSHTSPVTVPFTLGGSAVKGGDYNKSSPTTNTLTIAVGSTWTDIILVPIDDELVEADKSITVTLGNPSVGGLGATTSHTLSVISEDTAPQLTSPTGTTHVNEDVSTNISYFASDSDLDATYVSIKSPPSHGTVSINTTARIFTYKSDPDYNGADSFVVTVTDNTNPQDYTIAIMVDPVNDAPVINAAAISSSVTMSEDGSPTPFAPLTLTATDVDNDPLTWSVSAAVNGVASVVNGVVSYTPGADYNGDDSFIVTVSDGNGGSDTHTVDVTVTAVNDAPQALDDLVLTDEDKSVTFNVLDNDFDVEYETLTVITGNMTLASGATVAWGANGSVTYTPKANFNGNDSFNYTIQDGSGAQASATVTVQVGAVNDAPVITEGSSSNVTMSEDGSPTAFALTLHATDVDSDPLTWSTIQGLHGAVSVVGGVVSYTPVANYNGSDSFIVTVFDGKVSVGHTVNVTISAVGDAPIVGNDSATTNEDTAVVFNVLSNDSDPDGDTLTIITVDMGLPSGASVVWGTGGSVTYTPAANFYGSDSFSYTVRDSSGAQVDGNVTVTVNPVADAPVIIEGLMSDKGVNEDEVLTFTLHATDADNDPLIWGVAGASHGTASVNNGVVSYTPAANFNGSDSIIVSVSDGTGGSASHTVNVTIAAANDAPSLSLSASTLEVVAGASVSIDVTIGDVDGLDGATITARSVDGLGVVTVSGNRVTYAATTAGSDTVQITVTDAGGLSATRTAGVTVAAAPVAASSGGGGGGGSISWLLLMLGGLPLVRRRRAA